MRITKLSECVEFIAGDGCSLRELANAATESRAFRYSFAHAVVKPAQKTAPHRLKTSETYYILEGRGRMHIDREAADVGPGCFIDIPPMASQWIENTGPAALVFLCIVDPGWRKTDEILP
jgi:mannose-6-phosphate isomerase-like protein (cupin superfamily)